MRGGCLIAVATLAAASHAAAGTLWVAFPSGAEPCGYDQLEAALHARLGEVLVRPGVHDVGSDDVDVTMDRDGADWSLRVRAAGERELDRRLPKPGTDCVATTETAALMVERYLDDIRWTGGGAVVAKLPPLPPPPPPPRWQMVVEVGGGGELFVPQSEGGFVKGPFAGGGGSLDLGVRWGNWQAEASGGYFTLPTQAVGSVFKSATNSFQPATIQWFAVPAELALERRFSTGFGAFRLALSPGAEVFRATPSNTVYTQKAQTAPVPSLGLRLAYDIPIVKRLFLTVRAEVRGHGAAEFGGTGLSTVSTGYFDGNAILTLGYVFF